MPLPVRHPGSARGMTRTKKQETREGGRATLCRPVAQVVGWPVIRCPRTESSNDFCDRNAKVCDAGQDGCPDL